MNFIINRNGRLFGPYTRSDLERQVSQGLVVSSDLARISDSDPWMPLHQLLNSSAAHSAAPPPPFPFQTTPPPPTVVGDAKSSFTDMLAKRKTFVTPILVLINIAIFVFMVVQGGVSAFEPSSRSLIEYGADFGPLTLNGEWWRVFSSLFVHIGIVHLLLNMYALYYSGMLLEKLVGSFGFGVLYTLSGMAGSLASLAWHPDVVSAGASGAIFGLFGGRLAFLLLQGKSMPIPAFKALRSSTVRVLIINLVLGATSPKIDMSAHVGGLLAGFLFGLILTHSVERSSSGRRVFRGMLVFSFGCGILAVAADQIFTPVTREQASLKSTESPVAVSPKPATPTAVPEEPPAPSQEATQQDAQQASSYAQAIQSVLDADESLSANVQQITARLKEADKSDGVGLTKLLGELSLAVNEYVREARKLDTAQCPKDFAAAYADHLLAWENKATELARVSEAEAGGVSEAFLTGNSDEVVTTWRKVETLASNYGAMRK